jgi:outer membrane protein TolC
MLRCVRWKLLGCLFACAPLGCIGLRPDATSPPPTVQSISEPQQPAPIAFPEATSSPIRLVALRQEEQFGGQPPTPPAPDNQLLPPPSDAEGGGLAPAAPLETLPAAPKVYIEPPVREMNLATALMIAGGQSPRIAIAGARYREAYFRLAASRVLWLPSLRAGASYNHHDGRLQNIEGDVLEVSRSALNGGMGLGGVAAGSPTAPGVFASFHAADAIFQPRINEYAASARFAATRAETNDTLLDVAVAYLNLLRAVEQLRIAEDTRDRARQLADLTTAFAESGEGTLADADRARTELALRENEVTRAEEAAIVASARLAELLSLDPGAPIVPLEPSVVAIELVSCEAPLQELLATGLSNRPELAEARYLVAEAVQRYQRERYAPFIPSVLLGVSNSAFGGGTGSELNDFDDRLDLDAAAWWEIRNFGLGDRAQRNAAATRQQQANWQQVQTMDRVAREVIEAQAQVTARRRQIAVAEGAISAAGQSYRRNLERIREGQGLPLEALQSIQALDAAHREYLRAVIEYDEAQFRLQRALGWPIQ